MTNLGEEGYLRLLSAILEHGHERDTRNSITKSIFGKSLEFNIGTQLPLLTTKKMFARGIFEELMWFIRGQTDSKILEDKKVNIWKGNTNKEFLEGRNLSYQEGDIGNMYGFALRHAGAEYQGCHIDYTNQGFNQIQYCMNLLKNDKYSRRIIMTTFIPHEAHKGVLYPCHGIAIQFYVTERDGENHLSCQMTQRSGDFFHGIPYNISSYAILVNLMCVCLNNDDDIDMPFVPDRLIMNIGDCHIYKDHYEHVTEQLCRKPYPFPQIKIKDRKNIEDFEWTDIEIIDYLSHPKISADMVA